MLLCDLAIAACADAKHAFEHQGWYEVCLLRAYVQVANMAKVLEADGLSAAWGLKLEASAAKLDAR